MKQFIIYFCACLFIAACVGNGSDNAKLILNVEEIDFCERAVGETVVFSDVQLTNTGTGPLTLTNLAVRGDASCAFQVYYPEADVNGKIKTKTAPPESKSKRFDPVVIEPRQGIVLRVAYTPSVVGETDRADLILTGNAANLIDSTKESVTTVIPMCGIGEGLGSTDTDTSDTGDAGVEFDAGLRQCEGCGKALKKGADECEAGYDE